MNALWEQAVELAERELAHVRAAEWDLVAQVSLERMHQAASLPPAPASADRLALERLLALEERLAHELRAGRDTAVRELGALRRGRGAMRGYGRGAAPAAGGRGGRVDRAA